MLFIKRIITTSICFCILLVVFSISVGILGALADPNDLQTGEQFVNKYNSVLMISTVGLSGFISVVLAFGGIFPWCRQEKEDEN